MLYITVSEGQLMGKIEKVVNNNKKMMFQIIVSINHSDNQSKDSNLVSGNTNLEDNKESIIFPKEENLNEKPPEGDQGEKIEIKIYEDDIWHKLYKMIK